MREFGLIGYPLGHAYSQNYFEEKFKKEGIKDSRYQLFPLSDISKIHNIISSQPNLVGLNITTPYKELIIPYLNEIDSSILRLGTVNTIKIFRRENAYSIKGFNTDVDGLRKTFEPLSFAEGTKALIFGSGGSGKTVKFVLQEMGIQSTNVSREPENLSQISYRNVTEAVLNRHSIIVNATPVGMFPNTNACPEIPYEFISDQHVCLDLVYNPAQTLFLKKCTEKGAFVINGLTMLYEQADKAWEIWNNSTP